MYTYMHACIHTYIHSATHVYMAQHRQLPKLLTQKNQNIHMHVYTRLDIASGLNCKRIYINTYTHIYIYIIIQVNMTTLAWYGIADSLNGVVSTYTQIHKHAHVHMTAWQRPKLQAHTHTHTNTHPDV
jgi:hypothetical protein